MVFESILKDISKPKIKIHLKVNKNIINNVSILLTIILFLLNLLCPAKKICLLSKIEDLTVIEIINHNLNIMIFSQQLQKHGFSSKPEPSVNHSKNLLRERKLNYVLFLQ